MNRTINIYESSLIEKINNDILKYSYTPNGIMRTLGNYTDTNTIDPLNMNNSFLRVYCDDAENEVDTDDCMVVDNEVASELLEQILGG